MLELRLERVVAEKAGRNGFFDRRESRDWAARLNAERTTWAFARGLVEIGQDPDVNAVFSDVGDA